MNLLEQLYKIHSPSGAEASMKAFLMEWIRSTIPDVMCCVDSVGNLYVCKGDSMSYPCIVAHMDQVQTTHSHDFRVIEEEDMIYGFSPERDCREGLGADDKNGIWIALKCLLKYNSVKCAFFVEEEWGRIGSSRANMDFFSDCRFVLQCDRKGGNGLINVIYNEELCPATFLEEIGYQGFGYHLEYGGRTDVYSLKLNGLTAPAINISCGYYLPHTDEEYTIISELMQCLAFVEHIVETCNCRMTLP